MIQRTGNTGLETNLNKLLCMPRTTNSLGSQYFGPPAGRVGVKLSRELRSWKCQAKPIFRARQPGESPLPITINMCTLDEPSILSPPEVTKERKA